MKFDEIDESSLLAAAAETGEDPSGDEHSARMSGVPLLSIPILRLQASGHYEAKHPIPVHPIPIPTPIPHPIPIPLPPLPFGHGEADLSKDTSAGASQTAPAGLTPAMPWWFRREELRLDVDGRYPQMTASGTLYNGSQLRVHWIASLVKVGANVWQGSIWYKDGNTLALPHTQVKITATRSVFVNLRKATVTFSGGGAPIRTVTYSYVSANFHDVHLEFDCAAGTTAVLSVKTHDHPNRPASLPKETLSIEAVFNRAGFGVSRSGDSIVPMAGAGANARWSDSEMHDAMQAHWSRFADAPQWALWTFFAALHESGTGLGGIMFDDIGPNHRQGTAIFNDSFIATAPGGDANPEAWVRRMRFWTAVHEMGHAFNLAHSWQKSHPPAWGTPWIPLANEPEARSFMNYPYSVGGGQSAFFADFSYRFSDGELLFMRHAPMRFVQMGNADWFDNHGFEEKRLERDPSCRLEVRVNRLEHTFEFLEPIMIELKLTNVSDRILVVDKETLAADDHMTVILKKHGMPARQWAPYARYCREPQPVVLTPGESTYGSLFVSAGQNGWDIATPGYYTIQIAIEHQERQLVSQPLQVRVLPPRGYEEERLAQDIFSDEVGRVLAFDGTRFLDHANDVLHEAVERLPDRAIACHARIALAAPSMLAFKQFDPGARRPSIKVSKIKVRESVTEMRAALIENSSKAAETLGHIEYKQYVDTFSAFLAAQGEPDEAAGCQSVMHSTLSSRKVLPRVLLEIEENHERFQSQRKGSTAE